MTRLNYFAFGSNLSSRRLFERVPGATLGGIAALHGSLLCWRKDGQDLSAKCDIEFTGDYRHVVYGVIYRMTPEERLRLDAFEGEGRGYRRRDIRVVNTDGKRIDAFAYLALEIDHQVQPYHWYKEHVLRGALEHGLPQDYIESIRATPSIDDHDESRHRRELSIYPVEA